MVWDRLGENGDAKQQTLAINLTRAGFDVILAHSNYVYLDCGSSGWAHPSYWCQPYNEWFQIYQYMQDARTNFTKEEWSHVRGSQVLSWSEGADEWNTELRLWPRA